ncbi:MAG: hypothetical protein ACREEM_35805 [Blastocatellia bacterium]
MTVIKSENEAGRLKREEDALRETAAAGQGQPPRPRNLMPHFLDTNIVLDSHSRATGGRNDND